MPRGKLRIYLGAAPGVGKTYAMLNEGWRRKQRGVDVVVGFLETHGRPNTADQLRELEVIPRQHITYRGKQFQEMDLNAILARKPEQALVDELAHTNVGGSTNPKRWMDVQKLLDAGIDVISTLNIQHLESLNDVVRQITGIAQHETIPDTVVRQADQIELVDMTPEALRRRMAHGNIYPAEKLDTALSNYFRVGNLAALRELALLWVADRVEEALSSYMSDHGIKETWETRERVVVALTGAASGEQLIRRGARMAARTKGDLLGVHIKEGDGLQRQPLQYLERQRQLLNELGGTYHEILSVDPAEALVEFCENNKATRLVLGSSHRSRLNELMHGSIINKVIRNAPDVDIHIISVEKGSSQSGAPSRLWGSYRVVFSKRRLLIGWILVLPSLLFLALIMLGFARDQGLAPYLLIYLLAVVLISAIGGALPGLTSVAGSCVLVSVLITGHFIARHSLLDMDMATVASFALISVVLVFFVHLAAKTAESGIRSSNEAEALSRMTTQMLRQDNPLAKLLEELKERFALDSISIFDTSEKGRYNLIASFGDSPPLTPGDAKGVIKLPSNTVVAFNSAKGLEADDQRLMQAFCSHLCLAVDTLHLKEEKAQAEASLASDALRTALLAAVSHDLRTPLATIKTSADGLLQPDSKLTKEEVKELLMTIDREADRLNSLVANLLDASRLQTGVLNVTLQEVGLDEIVPAALAGIQERGRRLLVKVPEDLPRIKTDPVLLERAVVNIVDNAIAYSNVGASVRIEAGVVETLEGGFAEASRVDYARSAWTAPMSVKTSVDLRIIDTGPGIQRLDQDRVFSPFERLGNVPMGNGLGEDGQTGGGLGLGLAVAKGFVEAVGAKLSLEDTPGGGCVMIISLPIAKDNTPVTPGNTADPITEGHHSSGR